MTERLYLDHAAATPVLAVARVAMEAGLAQWANASSPHGEGRRARALLEDARARIAAALGWTGEVILTSGASEAIALAMTRAHADARLVSAVEHDAVHRWAADAVTLPVDGDGVVRGDALHGRLGALGAARPLVAIQAANGETGVVQPLEPLGEAVHAARGLLLVDASQSAGKRPLPAVADLAVVAAHKLGGPPGVGALLVRDLGLLAPTGGQERGYRGGTENLPGALGLAAALEAPRGWVERAGDLRAHLDAAVEAAGGEVVARGADRLPTVASYRMPGVPATAQLIQFDLAGIAVSAGSACSSGTLKPSPTLAAMGWPPERAGEVVRVSFGPQTTRADVYRFVDAWRAIAGRRRAA